MAFARIVAHLLVGALLAVSAGACHGGRIPGQYPSPPEVMIGTGLDQFVAIADGDAVPVIHGIQGGYHVWGSVRARFVDPQQIHLRFTITVEASGEKQAQRDDTIDLGGTTDGLTFGEHLGSAVIFLDVTRVRGQRCRFHLDVTDQEGRTASVEKTIVPT